MAAPHFMKIYPVVLLYATNDNLIMTLKEVSNLICKFYCINLGPADGIRRHELGFILWASWISLPSLTPTNEQKWPKQPAN